MGRIPMTGTYDAIVIGSGAVGASVAFHRAKLGGLENYNDVAESGRNRTTACLHEDLVGRPIAEAFSGSMIEQFGDLFKLVD